MRFESPASRYGADCSTSSASSVEAVVLRSRQHAHRGDAAGCDALRPGARQIGASVARRGRPPARAHRRRTEVQTVTGLQSPATLPAHAARHVRRAASEHGGHIDAARDGQVGARAARCAGQTSAGFRREPRTPVRRRRPGRRSAISNSAPATATDRSSSNTSSGPTSVTSSVAASAPVADERIGEAMRPWVHRTGHGHTARLQTPSSEILDGRVAVRADSTLSDAAQPGLADLRRTPLRVIG